MQGCRLFFRIASESAPPLRINDSRSDDGPTARVSALLQSVYPPLTLEGVRALIARACREVRRGGADGWIVGGRGLLHGCMAAYAAQAETPSEQMQVMQLTAALASCHDAAARTLSCPSIRRAGPQHACITVTVTPAHELLPYQRWPALLVLLLQR